MIRLLIVLTMLMVAASATGAPSGSATYTVTFDATWSAATHPTTFPGGPHFSGLVGGVHHVGADFWQEGQLASLGMKQMAEWGSQTTLMTEVEAAITAGTAASVLAGDVLWVSPGQTSLTLVVTPEHPLVTLVTMIAPSPDWFAGIDGLDLATGDTWPSEVVVPLYPYDAGTDSGVGYTSGDLATTPPDSIKAITAGPFAPGVPVGTLTFQLDEVSAAALPRAGFALSARPNPFNPQTELRYEIPAGATHVQLAIFDARGRLVRTLTPDAVAGPQTTIWNGSSVRGVRAAGGVYFARLVVDGAIAVQKVTLLP